MTSDSRRQRAHEVRRLRDMLRAAVQGGRYPDGQLPSEADLMASHHATRATVREALALLRAEGLIERVQGIGTHVVVQPVDTALPEAHGVMAPSRDSVFNRRMRPRVLDRSVVEAPATVAERLAVPEGTPCLRLEYVALHEEEPVGLVTNYVLFPEAARVRDTPFVSDWYALLADAGVELSESEFIFGCEPADPLVAPALGVRVGAPLIISEQIIYDPHGRPFDLAFIHTRGERFRFVSRAWRTRKEFS
ncbi:GntR family transcriptional regulator [Amycolatopsis cynarae]|uniref:GntR family transcriptional regulator n=1 Tax=Amycolatopsis cynarae TaxID=2995223 RepID=A0ABY7AXA2_9PSEU|nr:GntR family transcriptional regulator [Amycolatopsis sp. HUAS 11-8]WAL64349.1 GntR family transcriptional regulator [Amycolatopsis sp. HUAS 11-8]